MSVSVFVTIFIAEAALAGLLTEAVKQWYKNAGKDYSPNMIALVDSVILGALVTSGYYIMKGIPFSVNNIICLLCLIVLNWFGCMLGYDKILQLVKQLTSKEEKSKNEQSNIDTEVEGYSDKL